VAEEPNYSGKICPNATCKPQITLALIQARTLAAAAETGDNRLSYGTALILCNLQANFDGKKNEDLQVTNTAALVTY
jgi:hypothetical protein